MENTEINAPIEAFRFLGGSSTGGEFKFSEQSGEEDTRVRKLSLVGYSGGIIKNHWYWDDLAIDLSGMTFPKDRYPILFEHNTDQPVGFTNTPEIRNNQLVVDNAVLLDTDIANEFYANSKKGFPYEASVWVEPSNIEYVESGSSAVVNGYTLDGPATIFRKTVFKEVSVCTFGYDSQTSSAALSAKQNHQHSESNMTTTKLSASDVKEQHPEAFAAIVAEATAPLNEKLSAVSAQVEELNTKLSAATAEKEQAMTENKTLETRLSALEKEAAVRAEQDRRGLFSAKLSAKLSASDLPSRIHAKFSAFIKADDFFGEDGSFDEAKFSTTVDAEIAEWSTLLKEETPSVLGGGAAFSKTPVSGTTEDVALSETAARLAAMINPNVTAAE